MLLERASGPVDLLNRLLADAPIKSLLDVIGTDVGGLRRDLAEMALSEPGSPGCPQVLRNAIREAELLGHQRVGVVHLLPALLYSDVEVTAKALGRAGVTLFDLRSQIQSETGAMRLRQHTRPVPPSLRRAIRPSPVFLLPLGAMAAGAGVLYLRPGGPMLVAATFLFVIGGWITSVCLHEFGHAIVAHLGGDREVAAAGYLSLNPLRYANPVLSVLLPVVFIVMGGIGLPGGAVQVNVSALRSRHWDAAVSAAGPLMTLLFALAVALPFMLFPTVTLLTSLGIPLVAGLAFLVLLELGALLLNLLPIPSLDGFGIIAAYLSREARQLAQRIGSGGLFIVLLLLWLTPLGSAFWVAAGILTRLVQVPLLLAYLGLSTMTLVHS